MLKYRLTSVMLASVLGLTACGGDVDRTTDPDAPINQVKTQPVFNPAARQFPIPNDLLFGPETMEDAAGNDVPVEQNDGTMFAGVDASNPVISGIDALDGNSVLSPFDIAFNGSLDTSQNLDARSFIMVGTNVIPNPDQNVFLLPLDYPGGDSLVQVPGEVPTLASAAAYARATANPSSPDVATLLELAKPLARAEIISLDGGTNNVLRINPLKPLAPKTKYLVVLTNDIVDASGDAVEASQPYRLIKDPNVDLSTFGDNAATFARLRGAIQGWERLAAGYFGFQQQVFTAIGSPATPPTADDIVFSLTFTTAGTTDVLQYIAAPDKFFLDSLSDRFKKDAIGKLLSGAYSVNGSTTIEGSMPDAAIAGTLNVLLTSPTLPGDTPNPLYNPNIAGAIGGGATYAMIAADASAAYLMQRAAAEAAISYYSTQASPTLAQQAAGTVQALSMAPGVEFPTPAARSTNFFRVDNASALNPLLQAPAKIYQGEITLPYYQTPPSDTDLSPIKTSAWKADDTIRDLVVMPGEGDLPMSDKITYRYPFPTKQDDLTVPMLVTTPDEAVLGQLGVTKPAEGWPVIIFVHGITAERTSSLPMANALAFACINRDAQGNPTGAIPGAKCFATIAIDQPLHGIAAAGSLLPGFQSFSNTNGIDIPAASQIGDNVPSGAITERHFNATSDAASNPVPMNYDAMFGSSGSLFINLTNFTNVRDNLRQMSVDLMNLNASIATMDLNDDGTPDDLDPANVYFIGHSLGAIDGLPFVAINNSTATQASPFSSQPFVKAAVGFNTGGSVTRLLANSQSFAPRILGGLAAASESLQQGNSALELYFSVFQGVIDSADVTNFASSLSKANSDTGVLLTEIVGSDTNPADSTIPNSAADIYEYGSGPLMLTIPDSGFVIDNFPAPLAGTEPMLAQFGSIPTSSAQADDDPDVLVTRYSDGGHSTPASADNLPVFLEMVGQTALFFNLDGNVPGSIVTNSSVVAE